MHEEVAHSPGVGNTAQGADHNFPDVCFQEPLRENQLFGFASS